MEMRMGYPGERCTFAMANASATEITQRLIQFNTINPPGDERECTRYLGAMLEDAGFQVSFFEYGEGRTSLIARLAGSGTRPPICFGGHVDVVPLGLAPWSVEPFAGEIRDGKLYGRGSSDMKSGVAAFVHAGLGLAE
ncbi:MAG: M20/M25/M40 family metallo-hydrolase, partial [Woeseiaceae bacterium]|nr:M20/M25/M40 family metallo-hydrolase [Woeseiaceae bacterium]